MVEEFQCCFAGLHGTVCQLPLSGCADEFRVGLLDEEFQSNRRRLLEYTPLKPQEFRQDFAVVRHFSQLFVACLTESAQRSQIFRLCHAFAFLL
jgi:hypothetical protein